MRDSQSVRNLIFNVINGVYKMQDKKSMTGVIVAVVAVAVIAVGGFAFWQSNKTDDTAPEMASTNQDIKQDDQMKSQTIVDVASGDPQFSTLVTAIKAAGLADTLSGEGPFTVFAPTNEAFDKLPAGTLDDLLKNPEELAKILTYHVVSGDVKAADVVKLTKAATVNGKDVTVSVNDDIVKINDATITKTDIKASNGTIHVIDAVLLP